MVKTLSALLLLLMLVMTASCSQPVNAKQERDEAAQSATGAIVIGAAAPWANIQKEGLYWQGIEMARDEINKSGGVLGRQISILKKDDGGTVTEALIVAQAFADDPNVVAVIGHYDSYCSIATSILYEYYGIVMLSPTSTAPELTERKGLRYIFRNVPTDEKIAGRLAEFAKKRGYKRLMTYFVNNDYGRGLADAFEAHAAALDCTVVDRRCYDSTSPLRYIARDLEYWQKNFSFDAMFLAGEVPKAGQIIAEARRLGINVPVLGGDGLDSPELWQMGDDLAEGTIVATFFHPDEPWPEARAFTRAFIKRYGQPPDSSAAQGYDALKLLAYAMQKAGTTAPGNVADTLRGIKNWPGVTGPTTFNAHGDVVDKPIPLEEVQGKKFVLLKD